MMQRIRTVKPEFFRHWELFKAEKETGLPLRVAFPAIWTCCDREGRFKWRPEELKVLCLPYDDIDFSRVLHALATRGFLVKYASPEGDHYGFIPSYSDHQSINNKEKDSVLPNPANCTIVDENDAAINDTSDASSTRDPRVTHASPTRANLDQGEREQEREGKGTGKELLLPRVDDAKPKEKPDDWILPNGWDRPDVREALDAWADARKKKIKSKARVSAQFKNYQSADHLRDCCNFAASFEYQGIKPDYVPANGNGMMPNGKFLTPQQKKNHNAQIAIQEAIELTGGLDDE